MGGQIFSIVLLLGAVYITVSEALHAPKSDGRDKTRLLRRLLLATLLGMLGAMMLTLQPATEVATLHQWVVFEGIGLGIACIVMWDIVENARRNQRILLTESEERSTSRTETAALAVESRVMEQLSRTRQEFGQRIQVLESPRGTEPPSEVATLATTTVAALATLLDETRMLRDDVAYIKNNFDSAASASNHGSHNGNGSAATSDKMLPWVGSLAAFFETRSACIPETAPTVQELCYVSGREPRLWEDAELRRDLVDSICDQLHLDPTCTLLEVGCAAGFLAREVHPRVGRYVGMDLSPRALTVASSLGLADASFVQGDATRLPFPDASFDRVLCYDVLTNIPDMEYAGRIVTEMLRVCKRGGYILAGSIPDKEQESGLQRVYQELTERLEREKGPLRAPEAVQGDTKVSDQLTAYAPQIVCYWFMRQDFVKHVESLGYKASIKEIHAKNPYFGCRFNVAVHKDR